MADLLKVRAVNGGDDGLIWEFVDSDMTGYRIELDQPVRSEMGVQVGDVWQAQLVKLYGKQRNNRRAILRLVIREREVQPFDRLTEIPGFWMGSDQLSRLLILIHNRQNAILIGSQGTGKTTFSYSLAEAMGWPEPCKVEIAAVNQATQLFGSNAAVGGTTRFNKSYLLEYLERATIAYEQELPGKWLVILDEWSRAHAKIKAPLHGCLDGTRQLTISTEEGSRTIIVPPNVVFLATANVGGDFVGTFQLDPADMDRFSPVRMKPMPEDFEVRILVNKTGILESQAINIVRVARALRQAAAGHLIGYAPSFRRVEAAGVLVSYGMDLRTAIIDELFGYYEGGRDENGNPLEPNSEFGKAYEALTSKVVSPKKMTVAYS